MVRNDESISPVVAIDGSPAGITAGLWAIEEAVSRGFALRPVRVTDCEQTNAQQRNGSSVRH